MHERPPASLKSIFAKVRVFPEKFFEKVFPLEPDPFLETQPEAWSSKMPYEEYITIRDGDEDKKEGVKKLPICILEDGSLACMWEISPIEHEMIPLTKIKEGSDETFFDAQLNVFVSAFEKLYSSGISFQVIYESAPDIHFDMPKYMNECSTSAQFFMKKKVEFLQNKTKNGRSSDLKLMRRKIYLTMRVLPEKAISLNEIYDVNLNENPLQVYDRELKIYKRELDRFISKIYLVETNIKSAPIPITIKLLNSDEFISYMRGLFHSNSQKESNILCKKENIKYDAEKSVSKQILLDFVSFNSKAISLNNEDTVECFSWDELGRKSYLGVMTKLLKYSDPIRVVMNIRPCASTLDLLIKSYNLKDAEDFEGQILKEDIDATQEKEARGKKMFNMSFHVFVRNENVKLQDIEWDGRGKNLAMEMQTELGIQFVYEPYAAPGIFYVCLPFCYSKKSAKFTGREKRISKDIVSHFLPVFGGFCGTSGKRGYGQLLQNRSGEAIWLNQKDAESNGHLCYYGGSGSGKSFSNTDRMNSQLAEFPNSLFFIIDYLTSYEVWSHVMGESQGCQILSPPRKFPNLFRGRLNEDEEGDENKEENGDDWENSNEATTKRLGYIVSVIVSAIELISPHEKIGAVERMLLSCAIKKAYDDTHADATSDFTPDFEHEDLGEWATKKLQKVRIPRMQDIIGNLPIVAQECNVSLEKTTYLIELLAPFAGKGPYACLFDQEDYEDLSEPCPQVFVYNIDGVLDDPILGPITIQVIICEIMRQIQRPENKGRPGEIVIEEAGVLGASSKEIERFVLKAWKTFRKLKYSCIGLSNEVSDFSLKKGSSAMWSNSANKIILKSNQEEMEKATKGGKEGDAHVPPLLDNPFHGEVVMNLKKVIGSFSQGFWTSQETKGTFHYAPSPYNYWLAANSYDEKGSFHKVSKYLSKSNVPFPKRRAIVLLAENFPYGIYDENKASITITDELLNKFPSDYGKDVLK